MSSQPVKQAGHGLAVDRFITRNLATCFILVCVGTVGAESRAQTTPDAQPELTLETISRDWEKWAGESPSHIRWAPDGSTIHFEWDPDREGQTSLYTINAAGGEARELSPEMERLVPPSEPTGSHSADPVTWNRSRTAVTFSRQGDVFSIDTAGDSVRRITNTEAIEESPAFTHDQTAITFQSGNNLFLHSNKTGELVQLTNFVVVPQPEASNEQEQYLEAQQLELFEYFETTEKASRDRAERNRRERGRRPKQTRLGKAERVTDMSLAPGGDYVVFSLLDDTLLEDTRAVEYPDYVTKSGYTEMMNIGGKSAAVKPTVTFRQYRLGMVDVATGEVRYVDSTAFGKSVGWNPVVWSPDGKRAVAWAGSLDHKDIWLCVIDFASASVKVLFHEHADAWVRGFRGGRFQRGDGLVTGFLDDGRTVYFLSEQDGWYHLYTASTDGGRVRQLTKGAFEIAHPTLPPGGERWYFLSGEADPLQRHLYTMPLTGGSRTRLTAGDGWVEEYAVAPDEKHIAYVYGDPRTPEELFVMPNRAGAEPVRLTQSMSDEFRRYPWQEPEYVTFPDSSGWPVHAELYVPRQPDPRRPALIHVHGTGWTQGVAKRFTGYTHESRLEFQFLAEHGYTVLSVDYKGSRGYGRESRISVYRKMSVPELASIDAALEFLVEKHGIDRQRVGIYGHSYGGYLTLMALLTRPGTFAAGVAQAPVSDNAHSPTWFFMTRLLNLPWPDDEAYRQSSPIYYADRLQDRLLIIHGLRDTNVPVQDTFRLAQRFIELEKTGWDLAIYPVEPHIIRQESGRLDMFRRRFSLFESVLKAPPDYDQFDRQ